MDVAFQEVGPSLNQIDGPTHSLTGRLLPIATAALLAMSGCGSPDKVESGPREGSDKAPITAKGFGEIAASKLGTEESLNFSAGPLNVVVYGEYNVPSIQDLSDTIKTMADVQIPSINGSKNRKLAAEAFREGAAILNDPEADPINLSLIFEPPGKCIEAHPYGHEINVIEQRRIKGQYAGRCVGKGHDSYGFIKEQRTNEDPNKFNYTIVVRHQPNGATGTLGNKTYRFDQKTTVKIFLFHELGHLVTRLSPTLRTEIGTMSDTQEMEYFRYDESLADSLENYFAKKIINEE